MGVPQYYTPESVQHNSVHGSYAPVGGLRHAQSVEEQAMPVSQYGTHPLDVRTVNVAADIPHSSLRGNDAYDRRQEECYPAPRDGTSQNRGDAEPPYQMNLSQSRYYAEGEEYTSTGPDPSAYRQNAYEPLTGWGEAEYDYNATVRPSRVPEDPSSMYGKDASLHLKLQSLSILDNLVRLGLHMEDSLLIVSTGHSDHPQFGQAVTERD